MTLPGYLVDAAELEDLGFKPLELRFGRTQVEPAEGLGCEWVTVGDVPDSPGLYAFTAERNKIVSVLYVGMTEHLWMVTKGRLPNGASRPAQRYGRPRYAGMTRQRINIEIAQVIASKIGVRHWVSPRRPTTTSDMRASLRAMEEELIGRWKLRSLGWNRG